jgi:hypothetical protein
LYEKKSTYIEKEKLKSTFFLKKEVIIFLEKLLKRGGRGFFVVFFVGRRDHFLGLER